MWLAAWVSFSVQMCCCLDPLRTAKGRLSLKALRLTPSMMNMYHEGDFTHEAYVMLCVIIFKYHSTSVVYGYGTEKSAMVFHRQQEDQ